MIEPPSTGDDGPGDDGPGDDGPRPPTRLARVLGLLAAVGFSLAIWAFIAVAVLGLVLKVLG